MGIFRRGVDGGQAKDNDIVGNSSEFDLEKGQSSKSVESTGTTNDENLLIDSDHGLWSKSILFSDSGYECDRRKTPEKRYIETEILSV